VRKDGAESPSIKKVSYKLLLSQIPFCFFGKRVPGRPCGLGVVTKFPSNFPHGTFLTFLTGPAGFAALRLYLRPYPIFNINI